MSARRAAVRRERKEREKMNKYNSANGEMIRLVEQGKIDGRTIAFCVVANTLYDVFGFRKKKLETFLNKCNKEATRFENEGVNFVVQHYAEKISKRLNEVDVFQKPERLIDCVYINQRDMFYVSSLAITLVVLNSDYGMASNNKGTGRLDTIMEYCTNEYIKIQLDPKNRSAEWRVKKTREKTGIFL